jgi:hypothetical protein
VDALSARLWALAVLLCLSLSPAFGQHGAAPEVRIKAAFLYKFCSFVEWPPASFAEPGAAFTIGVLGADALAEELARVVESRTVDERPVLVRKLRRGASLAGLQVLFVGGQDASRLADILEAARGMPLLTVTETTDRQAQGSMINFVLVDDKVRFDVALPPAEAGHLRISSRLLAVARKVLGGAS